jgi:hypothetical protein
MAKDKIESFPDNVLDKLGYYVYRLIDPRNGETFYVGRGKSNRVFAHIRGDLEQDKLSEKHARIREIQFAGLDVVHVIHRHGMDETTASVVEAALIDAYPGLTNQISGSGSSGFGVMHAKEIINQYSAEEAIFHHKALLITVKKSASERSPYDATRYAWRLDKNKAEQAEIILAVQNGIIRKVYIAERWLEATPENFPISETISGRYGFVGHEASDELQQMYVDKRIPDEYRKPGATNPIKYTW